MPGKLRPHGTVPEPVPVDLTAPPATHVVMSPELIPPSPATALQRAMAELGIEATALGLDPAFFATAGPAPESEGYSITLPPEMTDEGPSVSDLLEAAGTMPDDMKMDTLIHVIGELAQAVRDIGEQQQWVTDQVAGLTPLFAQLDTLFAGASSPVDILKGLMGLRKKVIDE